MKSWWNFRSTDCPALRAVSVSGLWLVTPTMSNGWNQVPSGGAGLQAERLHLRRDVALRQAVAARRRTASLEQVVRQEAHVRPAAMPA